MKLYRTEDGENVINKSLTLKHNVPIKFKESVNISSPIVKIRMSEMNELLECNYCYIPEFSRYYFIRDFEIAERDIYILSLECDVLESFKIDILNSFCEYRTSIKEGDYGQVRGLSNVNKVIETFESNIEIQPNKTVILSTIGG